MKIKIAIIQFPGSNCERETILAIERVGMEAVPFFWNEDITKLHNYDGYIIVGGFSYEDRIRAGIIAALDPVMQHIADAGATGKPILGICNGAQILVECGLVPGVTDNKLVLAIALNKRIKDNHILGYGYYNDWVYITTTQKQKHHAFLGNLPPGHPIYLPVAHGEGRFILAEGLWEKITATNIACMHYCDKCGNIKDEFPINPNGAQHNLAALSNTAGNIMAIMPHPERTSAGDVIFSSMRDYILENKYRENMVIPSLEFVLPPIELTPYILPRNTQEQIVELIINDNTAISTQQALHNLQFATTNIKRYTHWEISFEEKVTLTEQTKIKQKIDGSYELFNPNKEVIYNAKPVTSNIENSFVIIVQDKENIIGQHKHKILQRIFGLRNIKSIKYGNLWCINAENNIDKLKKFILDKHILFNPFSQNGFWYPPFS